MLTIIYYSRNAKKTPFEVTVQTQGQLVNINCNCSLGLVKKICRHKINAIRGDKENRHSSTTDEVIVQLRHLFGPFSTLRQHLEEKWRLLREYVSDNPENELEIENKRRILGEAFANGFVNENSSLTREPFDADVWEANRDTYINNLNCPAALMYVGLDGVATTRDVLIEEVFKSNSRFYLLGYCSLRKHQRTFRVDRIHGINFGQECTQNDKSQLLNVLFQINPISKV